MEFNPNNKIIKLCLSGMQMEEKGDPAEAKRIFMQAWKEASHDFEKFTAAYYVARHQVSVQDKLEWLEKALRSALNINDLSVAGAFPSLYTNISKCYEELKQPEKAKEYKERAESFIGNLIDRGPFYHGTKADLKVGELLTPGWGSNYKTDLVMNHIYFTALANGAGLAAALAKGEGKERVYIVEPTGSFENDPNVTDKKFPGNPSRSYRTQAPLKIVGEVTDYVKQKPADIQKWRERLEKNKGDIIN